VTDGHNILLTAMKTTSEFESHSFFPPPAFAIQKIQYNVHSKIFIELVGKFIVALEILCIVCVFFKSSS
jgi:hypothetical protein